MQWKLPERVRHLMLADTLLYRGRACAFGPGGLVGGGGVRLGLGLDSGARLLAAGPVGASVVILFALSHSPLAQPWPVLGGYACATAAGLACLYWVPYPFVSAALAVGLTVVADGPVQLHSPTRRCFGLAAGA